MLKRSVLTKKKLFLPTLKQIFREKITRYFLTYNRDSLPTPNLWEQLRYRIALTPLLMASLVLVTWSAWDWVDPTAVAGRINPLEGSVQIVRDGTSRTISHSEDLLVGDWIQTGASGRAEIFLTNQMASTAESGTFVRVSDANKLFLEQGELNNLAVSNTEIATNRGAVLSPSGSSFALKVSSTGETKVSPQTNKVQVFDLREGSLSLQAGEEVWLKSDTELSQDHSLLLDRLAPSHLRTLQAQFNIVRSKIITALQLVQDQNHDAAKKNLASARQSYVATLALIQNGRESTVAKRKNLERTPLQSVVESLKRHQAPAPVLDEAIALAVVLKLAESIKSHDWLVAPSEQIDFNRYQLLWHLLRQATEWERDQARILLEHYPLSFLEPVEKEALWLDRISILNQQIDQLPNNSIAEAFLEQVARRMNQNLAQIVEEKMQNKF